MSEEIKIGSQWKHRKKGFVYRVTELRPLKDEVYLQAQTKGARSTWKYGPLVPFDYEPLSAPDKSPASRP